MGFDSGTRQGLGFDVEDLITVVTDATNEAQDKIQNIKNNNESVSIGDMFEMQMLMNHLSQLSEMSTAVVSASHAAIKTMAQNVRG